MTKKKAKRKVQKSQDSDIKRIWKKFWWFIWEDNSAWSWLVNIILAFILIKFIVYPFLGLIFQTGFPIVAVVSSSMEHDGSFEEWWGSAALCNGDSTRCAQEKRYMEYEISKEEFKDFPFKNGFNKGDIMILYGTKPEKIAIGDVIVFVGNRPDPIIHRVVQKGQLDGKYYFSTKGDHNPTSFGFENHIDEDLVLGTAKLRVPLLGYIKIGFVKLISFISNLF